MEIQIAGHSGCHLEVKKNDGVLRVLKRSGDSSYNDRLKRQMDKQIKFATFQSNEDLFKTAVVVDYGLEKNSNLFWFLMDYIRGEKATEYFARIDVFALKETTRNYLDYFEEAIEQSKIAPCPKNIIESKIEELKYKYSDIVGIPKEFLSSLLNYLSTEIPESDIYSGNCHGDFSLSNQLYTQEGVILLDFLDSFIESPIIDIAKLRQDTQLKRILLIDVGLEVWKKSRANLAFSYLDDILSQFVSKDPILQAWSTYMQVFNLARIIPYTSNQKELDYLKININKLIKQ